MKISRIKSTITGWIRKHPVIVFLGLFVLQMLVFYSIYLSMYFQGKLVTPIATGYAWLSGKALNLFGFHTTIFGDTISSAQFSIAIKKGCDALEPMALFVAGLFAFPTPIRKKLIGLFFGLCILFFINIIRIITLFIAGVYSRSLFDAMHLEIWQAIFILVAIAMWFVWLRWAVKKVKVS
jgi:exosortase H (IPTLxxWG-CTERM-specific)